MMNSIHNIVKVSSLRLVLVLSVGYFSIYMVQAKDGYMDQLYNNEITELPPSILESTFNNSNLLLRNSTDSLEQLYALMFAVNASYRTHSLTTSLPYAGQVESIGVISLNFFKIIPYGVIAILLVALIFMQKRKTKYEKDIQDLLKQLDQYKTVKPKAKANPSIKKVKLKKYKASTLQISKETLERIKNSLEEFEQNNMYLNSLVSASMLASYCRTNIRYVSDVINRHKGQSITSYISNLRINYILLKLKREEKYRNYKIRRLAEEAGYSSPSKFSNEFKRIVGVAPSIYIASMHE